jgi:EmrB/QacA subfamily drug resistance transporter
MSAVARPQGRARAAAGGSEPATRAADALRAAQVRPTNVLLVLVCMAQFMIVLDISIVNVALPSIRSDMHFSTTGLQWVVSAYTLAFAGFLMLGGRASDLIGRRRMFLVGTASFTLASLLCALASSRGLLLGARAVQGLAGAVVSPATLAILTTSFAEGVERNRALGIWGAMSGLGASAGALLGGVLTATVGWQAIFLVNVPIGIAVVAAGRRVIAEGRGDGERHFDVTGAVLVTAGLVGIVYGIVRSGSLGWLAVGVLAPIAGGLATLALFALVEHRVARVPLVPLAIFRRSQLNSANIVVLLLYGALFSMFYFVTLYMQQVLHYSALHAGLGFLPMTLGVFTASNLASRVIARLGTRRTVTLGMISAAAGMSCFSGVHPDASYAAVIVPGSLLTAAGLGLALVAATVAAVQGVPSHESGLASALVNTSRFVGGALGLAALSTLAASHTHAAILQGSASAQALTDGYGTAFRAGAVVCLFGAAVALTLIRSRPQAVHAEPLTAVD